MRVTARLVGSLLLAQARAQPARLVTTLIAIMLGVALASAIYTISGNAASAFDKATRRLSGDADFIIRGPRGGFDERLYAEVAKLPGVASANPALEIPIVSTEGKGGLTLIGLDAFRLLDFRPSMYAEMAESLPRMFDSSSVYLTADAARQWDAKPGEHVGVLASAEPQRLHIVGVLSARESAGARAYMDLGVMQWAFELPGRLNRIDVRLEEDADAAKVGKTLAAMLPAGVSMSTPDLESERAAGATRAYRTNLNMLALVSVLTGAVLLMSTQALSILRRRESLGLLRALGVTREELERALVLEGTVIGLLGAIAGVIVGQLVATWVLVRLGTDFGSGLWPAQVEQVDYEWFGLLIAIGVASLASALASWWPAYEGAKRSPAKSLRPGDAATASSRFGSLPIGLALCLLGSVMTLLPAIRGMPWAGYAAIGAWLLGGILLVPFIARTLLGLLPGRGGSRLSLAVAQLRASVGQVSIGLAAMIVSFSLMVAMIVMVHSFRGSFVRWLDASLPSDLIVRVAPGSDGIVLAEDDQRKLAGLPGVRRVQFSRTMKVTVDPARPPIVLIARDVDPAMLSSLLTVVEDTHISQGSSYLPIAWMSEAVADVEQWSAGSAHKLDVLGHGVELQIVGTYRDYGNPAGSITMTRNALAGITGDRGVNEVAVWLVDPSAAGEVIERIRDQVGIGPALQVRSVAELRAQALRGFDRAFAITWALELVAVIIGLLGVSFAATSMALARRAEFGMLRHLGMRRSDVQRMLVAEGLLTAFIATFCALLLGAVISVILVHVVNRQSFHWSVDLAYPWLALAGLAALLIAAAGVTAVIAGRAAIGQDVVRAVKEDW